MQENGNIFQAYLHFYFTCHQQAHNRKGPLPESHDEYLNLACGNDLPAMLLYLENHMRQGLETTINNLEITGNELGA